jgi:hypothetical protein
MARSVPVILVLSFLVCAAAVAGERPATHERQVDQPATGDAGDLPTISRYQVPRVVPNVGCLDPTIGQPCQNDYGDPTGGYTQGGCNCSRICYEGNSGCSLSVPNNGCIAGSYPNQCKSCSYNCG